ncbi:MAG: hypothetical protein JXA89_19765 [Anaerolineae bacterium]|nr:hypothetical protein [Anaerolineae bacterium]
MDKRKITGFLAVLALVLLAGAATWVTLTLAASEGASLPQGGVPSIVAYQGEVQVGGVPYTGVGYFKFALVNAAGNTTYWSNDGSSNGGNEPALAVQLQVDQGLFSVLLGDTGMQPLTASVFAGPNRYLRVWFSQDSITFSRLLPDTRIAAVPYALQAKAAAAVPWSGITGMPSGFADGTDDTGSHYAQVVVVAQEGGDFDSVQAAIDSITDAAAGKPYLVWIAPGVYSETVTMKPYVHLQGAGQAATVITSTAFTSATLVLTDHVSLRDLTVGNGGTGAVNVSILAGEQVTNVLIANVTAHTVGNGAENRAICLDVWRSRRTEDRQVRVVLQDVTALAENGNRNYGLYNVAYRVVVLDGGSYTARGGSEACGIRNAGIALLQVNGVTILAENANSNNGLFNADSRVLLRSSDITARGGSHAGGLVNASSDLSVGSIDAEGVVILAEQGSDSNYGQENLLLALTDLRGGSITARGGISAYGIYNAAESILTVHGTIVLAENASGSNYGLYNVDNSEAYVDQAQLIGASGGVTQTSGTVYLGSTKLDGGAVRMSGTMTCCAVYDGNYVVYSCP